MKPIKEENRVEILAELQKFANWVKRWQNQFPNYGLSKPTFETIFQTVMATTELSKYEVDVRPTQRKNPTSMKYIKRF